MTTTSAVTSQADDTTMADLSPSMTFSPIATQSNDRRGDISTSYDVATPMVSETLQHSISSEPFSSDSATILDDASSLEGISETYRPNSITASFEDLSESQSALNMPPSWISGSLLEPSGGFEHSIPSASSVLPTPSIPQQSKSKSDFSESDTILTKSTATIEQSQNVIPSTTKVPKTSRKLPSRTKVVSSSSKINIPSRTKVVSPSKTRIPLSTVFSSSPTVLASSAIIPGIIPGILPRDTTPYSGDTKGDKNGFTESGSDYPNATILFIIVPVCIVVFLVAAAIIVACVRRRKLMKKPEENQNPDLWVDTRPEIALVPAASPAVDTPTEAVPGFEPGDIVCRVVYPFSPQLEGQMSLREKQLVKILEKTDNGWWRGAAQSGESSGWFPGCYVEEVKPGHMIEDGTQSQSKGKSRVSSFMLKKRERMRRKSATAVSPLELPNNSAALHIPTSKTFSGLNSAEINKFNEGKLLKAKYAYQGSSKGELSIEEGDLVRGWERDRNGWMHGRKVDTGQEGWFPAVYVDEVPSDTSSISGESTLSGPVMYDQLAPNRNRDSDQEWLGIEHKALFPYIGQSETDLTFETGNTIIVYETLDNGWWLGSRGEEVGWLPGSYLEIKDDDSSKSDVSSILSGHDDRTRPMEEDPSPSTSNRSSTFSETKPKPKPVRKAPPPPKLKPLKIPVRNIEETNISDIEIHAVSPTQDAPNNLNYDNLSKSPSISMPQRPAPPSEESINISRASSNVSKGNVQSADTVSLSKTPSMSNPRRPAPPPPPQRTASRRSVPDPALSSTDATTVTSSMSRLNPGEKPFVPKRFAKPKVIRIPRQSSRLSNLAASSQASTRSAPPRPPPPKFAKSGNQSKVPSSNNISGIYLKKSDPAQIKSPTSSFKALSTTNDNDVTIPTASNVQDHPPAVPGDSSQAKPSVPEPVYARIKQSVKKVAPKRPPPIKVDENSNESVKERPTVSPARIEDSPKVYAMSNPGLSVEPTKPDESIINMEDPVESKPHEAPVENESDVTLEPVNPESSVINIDDEEDVQTHLYPLETGPTMSPPVVPPEEPAAEPEEPIPYENSIPPKLSPEPSTSEVSNQGQSLSPPIVPRKSISLSPERAVNIHDMSVSPFDNTVDSSSDSEDHESNELLPTVVNNISATDVNYNVPVEEPEEYLPKADGVASHEPQESPEEESPEDNTSSTVKTVVPPIIPRVSPPREISPPKEVVQDSLSTSPQFVSQAKFNPTGQSDQLNGVDVPTPQVKPVLLPKPSKVPPPLLPKPKIKPKPARLVHSQQPLTDNVSGEFVLPSTKPLSVPNNLPSENSQTPETSTTISPVPDIQEDCVDHANPDIKSDPSNSDIESDPTNPDIDSDHIVNSSRDSDSDETHLDRDPGVVNQVFLNYERKPSIVLEDQDQEEDQEPDRDDRDEVHSDSISVGGSSLISDVSSAILNSSSDKSDSFSIGRDENPNHSHSDTDVMDVPTNSDHQHLQSLNKDSRPENGSVENPHDLINNTLSETSSPKSSHESSPVNGSISIDSAENGLQETQNHDSEASPAKKPVPRPRASMSPDRSRPEIPESKSPESRISSVPPVRPPPPRSPTANAHRLINQGDGDKSKKKTLRRAVKTHVPLGKGELAFEEGSYIKEMSKAIGRPGWCIGMLADGNTGLYPQSHVEDATSTKQSYV